MEKPLFELVDEQEFTNREPELKYFWNLAMKAKRNNGSSEALIARKGVGKTAILVRLYNDLFTKQDEVVPFFITFAPYEEKTENISVSVFNQYYFTTVMKQYIAFRLRKPEMVETNLKRDKLYDLAMKNGLEELEEWFISYRELQDDGLEAVRRMVAQMTFRLMHNKAGFLIIDEFQILTHVWDEVLQLYRSTVGMFQRPAEARWCPMLVSGSAVSLTEKAVLSNALAKLFGLYDLAPFEKKHTLEYVAKLAQIRHLAISDDVISSIHNLTGGNPFYIRCLSHSKAISENNLSTLDRLLKVYEYEICHQKGYLRDFWDTHFATYADKLNSETVARAMYFLSLHPGKDIGTHEVAAEIGEDNAKTRKVLQNLYDADLVERNSLWRYIGITVPVLRDYIKRL